VAEKLTGKIIITGEIENTSPVIIGSGLEDNESDILVIKNWEGDFYIPAASFAGVLRHRMLNTCKGHYEQFDYFWGVENQSAMIVNDLMPANKPGITIRDGVAIDNLKGIAKDKEKYNYEVVEPGAVFNLKIEINIREEYEKDYFLKTVATILDLLSYEKISTGAMTSKGFGRIKLRNSKVYVLDFSKTDHSVAWLTEQYNKIRHIGWSELPRFDIPDKKFFSIDAYFLIKSSLIIGAYSSDPQQSDKTHIKSNNKPVLTGTSIKGVIRSRAERVINTLGGNGEELLKNLMGWVDKETDDKIKSRVIVEETLIEEADEIIQTRIKIDRFTGGTLSGALFDSQPLWRKDNSNKMINIRIKLLNYQNWEAGLMLLILKDLWNEDLPIGGEKNVGRGILQGLEATIKYNDKEIVLTQQPDSHLLFSKGRHEDIEWFAAEFNNYLKQNNEAANAKATQ
jgi:CRISPR/Cas system CSM-associated protein Csm3 (group 7 of RAMP superfamily)